MAALTPLQDLLHELDIEVQKEEKTMTSETLYRKVMAFREMDPNGRESRIIPERLYDLLETIPMSYTRKDMIRRAIQGVRRSRSPIPGNKHNRNVSNSHRNSRHNSTRNSRFTSRFPRTPIKISMKYKSRPGMNSLKNALPKVSMNSRGTMGNLWNSLPSLSPNVKKSRSNRSKNRSNDPRSPKP